jgi:hypothetical protein
MRAFRLRQEHNLPTKLEVGVVGYYVTRDLQTYTDCLLLLNY